MARPGAKLQMWEIRFVTGSRLKLRAEDEEHARERALAMCSQKARDRERKTRFILSISRLEEGSE